MQAFDQGFYQERVTRIELALSAWEAPLPPCGLVIHAWGVGPMSRGLPAVSWVSGP